MTKTYEAVIIGAGIYQAKHTPILDAPVRAEAAAKVDLPLGARFSHPSDSSHS